MALDLSTYSGLQSAVADYLNRRDLSASIPAFIRQAHAKFNRELRVRDMQCTYEGTSQDGVVEVPDDFLAPYSFQLATPTGWCPPLSFISEMEADEWRARCTGQFPRAYSLFADNFELIPGVEDDVSFRIRYYAQIPSLVASTDTNWLLFKAPDLYVVSSCLEAMPYLRNDERLQTWAALRSQIMDAMMLESERALKPQSSLRATTRTFG
jgi:hypothetical protein